MFFFFLKKCNLLLGNIKQYKSVRFAVKQERRHKMFGIFNFLSFSSNFGLKKGLACGQNRVSFMEAIKEKSLKNDNVSSSFLAVNKTGLRTGQLQQNVTFSV